LHELMPELSANDDVLNAGVYDASFRQQRVQCGSSAGHIESWFKEP